MPPCPRSRPSGAVTFLATGVEDQARHWEQAPEDMSAAVPAHDDIVRSAIEQHAGYVFAATAEGFCAAFASPADAASASGGEAQRELADADAIPFAVRMAIHTGEAGDRDGSYAGADANRTGRLMALAHGGQVLVSDTAEVLLRSRATLRPLGEHLLRGHRGRISVFQLMADGLAADFPVLRSTEPFAGNLPRQVSSLVGRDAEVDAVTELVRARRLVTLTGVGGVGKTRLAIEVGAELAGEFEDGVWIVELAGIADPEAIPAALADGAGHHSAKRRAADRDDRRDCRRPAHARHRGQLRARAHRGGDTALAAILGQGRARPASGHVT